MTLQIFPEDPEAAMERVALLPESAVEIIKPGSAAHKKLVKKKKKRKRKKRIHHHKVKSGESLWTIARKYKVKLNDLMRWNGLNRNAVIRPGQSIKILF